MEDTLFSQKVKRPLADRLRPQNLSEVVGQDHVVGPDAPLGRMVKSGKITSFILWGPPGCGKTTIARLIAEHTNLYFEQISAVFSGVGNRYEADNRQETWVITSSDFLYRLTSSVSFRYSFFRTSTLVCFITSVNSLRRGSSR